MGEPLEELASGRADSRQDPTANRREGHGERRNLDRLAVLARGGHPPQKGNQSKQEYYNMSEYFFNVVYFVAVSVHASVHVPVRVLLGQRSAQGLVRVTTSAA